MEGNNPRVSTMAALGIDWLEDDEFIARMEKAIMEGDVAEILKLTGAEEIMEEAKRQVCSLPPKNFHLNLRLGAFHFSNRGKGEQLIFMSTLDTYSSRNVYAK